MRPRWILNPAEVKVLDANAEALGVNLDELMIKAATELALALEGAPEPIWILCGPGNNGGDGFRLAEILEECHVIATHKTQKTELSKRARSCWKGEINYVENLPEKPPAVIVDCLLGAGSNGKPRGEILRLMESIPGRPMVLACDMPTGCGSGIAFNAFRTVTFESPKSNMVDQEGRLLPEVGDLFIASLGWPEEVLDPGPGDLLRYPISIDGQLKGDRGRVMIVGGGPYHGAPILAGMAAARMGVDLVHVAMPIKAAQRATWPSDLIPEKLSDNEYISDVTSIVKRCMSGRGVQAMVIGPGMGTKQETLEAVRLLIESTPSIPKVIDADAIRALSDWPESLIGVVTPHQKELENWIGSIDEIPKLVKGSGEDRVVIRTGSEDLIIGAGGRGGCVKGGNPRMAMGGTGDLLAGCIGGLLALGLSPWSASRLGTYLLRVSGKIAGDEIGPGLVAEDIPLYLSKSLK
ncbi:MAG: NAD(P)H-hydrate dehydratase [Candidatus Poseidoniaceae archaeon]|jgi:NAD(P)H-hydrate epimerase|nr:NAD(P)H-hydrate dehydratase [Candidatus Poseidoniaceae archaeon]